jgi:hypothetical protein
MLLYNIRMKIEKGYIMKKSIIALAVSASLLGGCASINPFTEPTAEEKVVNKIEFLATNGGIKLEFDGDKWVSIESTGIAEVTSDRINSAHEAYHAATLRAQRNLSEYLNNKLDSKTTLDAISQIVDSDDVAKPSSDTIAYNLTESISKESHSMLNGLYVTERKYDEEEKLVSVTVKVTPQSLRASAAVRTSMGNK